MFFSYGGNGREVITADRTYYVATTGNDSNDGLTVGTPFLTIQKALDVLETLDGNGHDGFVQLADGTYTLTTSITLPNLIGFNEAKIVGNATTPANVVLSCSVAMSGMIRIIRQNINFWVLEGFRLTSTATTGAMFGLFATNSGSLRYSNLNFGAMTSGAASYHAVAANNGSITAVGSYAISGGASSHFGITGQYGRITASFRTITITNTPAFAPFVYCDNGEVRLQGNTFTGSATGSRYSVLLNGMINVFGAGTSHLPGNAAGTVTTATYGVYA